MKLTLLVQLVDRDRVPCVVADDLVGEDMALNRHEQQGFERDVNLHRLDLKRPVLSAWDQGEPILSVCKCLKPQIDILFVNEKLSLSFRPSCSSSCF